jgi:hypothetical protein
LPELKEALQKILSEEKDGITALDAVLKTLRNRALKGDVRAIQEILDRFYGKVKQEHSLEGIPPAININVTSQETAEKLKKYLNGS